MGLTVDISFVLGLDLDLLTDGGVRVAFHCSQPDHCLVVQFGTPQEALKGEGSAWAFQPQGLGASQELRGQLGAGPSEPPPLPGAGVPRLAKPSVSVLRD